MQVLKKSKTITFLRWLYNKSIQHWWISASIPNIPTLFILITVFGFDLGLKNQDGTLNTPILVISLVLYIPAVVFMFLKSSADRWNEKSKIITQKIFGYLNQYLTALKELKFIRFANYMSQANPQKNPFSEITKPKDQIDLILDSLRGLLCDTLGINLMNIGASVLYKIDDSEWKWLATQNIKEGISREELTTNSKTTAYNIIKNHKQYIFHADKRVGIDKREYKADARDDSNQNIGSIYCSNISIDDHSRIHAVLSLSSYGEQFCNSKDLEVIELLTHHIFPTYEMRIKLELALHYIKVKHCG